MVEASELIRRLQELRKSEHMQSLLRPELSAALREYETELENEHSEQEAEKAANILKADLDPAQMDDFETRVVGEWKAASYVRTLMQEDAEVSATPDISELPEAGLNQLVPKGLFVDESVSPAGIAVQFGAALAQFETDQWLQVLESVVPPTEVEIDSDIAATIANEAQQQRARGAEPCVIALDSWQIVHALADFHDFTPLPQSPRSSSPLIGRLSGDTRVYSLHRGSREGCFVGDLRTVLSWVQGVPSAPSVHSEFLQFVIETIDFARAQDLLKQNPGLARGEDTQTAVARLCSNAQVRIREWLKISPKDGTGAVRLVAPDNPEKSGAG